MRAFAVGGFSGNDPIFTIDSFRYMTATEGPRYFLMTRRLTTDMRRGTPQEPILGYIRSNWPDTSRSAGLPPGTLYTNPNWQ